MIKNEEGKNKKTEKIQKIIVNEGSEFKFSRVAADLEKGPIRTEENWTLSSTNESNIHKNVERHLISTPHLNKKYHKKEYTVWLEKH